MKVKKIQFSCDKNKDYMASFGGVKSTSVRRKDKEEKFSKLYSVHVKRL